MKHTPGPWIRKWPSSDDSILVYHPKDGGVISREIIGVVWSEQVRSESPSPEIMRANARLIAKAPDLLEKLDKVIAQFADIADDKWPTEGMKVVIEEARELLDKVKGEVE